MALLSSLKAKRKGEFTQRSSNRQLNLDFFQLGTAISGVVILSVFGYYAIKLLASFKKGVLESGWKQVTFGTIFLVLAQFLMVGAGFCSSNMESVFSVSVLAVRFVGIVLLILGFRAHYQVWRLDNKNIGSRNQSNEPLEWQN